MKLSVFCFESILLNLSFWSILGKGGVGKTSWLKKIALDWVQGACSQLNHIDNLFFIKLRDVADNSPLESIILEQHSLGISGMVTPEEIQKILSGDQTENVMLIFDGYDEYRIGTNRYIEEFLSSGNFRGSIIVSVRSDHENIERINGEVYDEIQLTGLSSKAVLDCLTENIGNQAAVSEIRARPISKLLHIPLFLLMTCMVYKEVGRFPNSESDIVGHLIEMSVRRVLLKKTGKTLEDREINELLIRPGQQAWNVINEQHKPSAALIIDEPQIELSQDCSEVTNNEAQPPNFHYKLLQEYLAARFLVSEPGGKLLKSAFPSWKEIRGNINIVRFVVGILGAQSDVIGHICCTWNKHITQRLENAECLFGSSLAQHDDLTVLQSFQNEALTSLHTQDLCIFPTYGDVSADSLFLSDILVITDLLDKNSGFDNRIFSHFEKVIIDLRSTKVHGADIKSILDICNQNSAAISLRGCSVFTITAMPCFALVTNLTYMSIVNCTLEKSDLEMMSLQLSKNTQLKFIEIRSNSVPIDGIKFTESMSKADTPSTLNHLDLSGNRFAANVSKVVLSWVTSCSYLRILHLARNVLTNQLGRLMTAPPPSLEKLILCSTQLTGHDVMSIADAFKHHKLSVLQRLDMTHNDLHDSHAQPLIEELSKHLPSKLSLSIRAGNCLSNNLLGFW